MREKAEGIGYYLSCMIFFNAIYALSIASDGCVLKKCSEHYDTAGLLTFITAVLLTITGIISTIGIVAADDSCSNTASTGKQFEILTIKDLTCENYFANFSVIVLTGIALPSRPDFWILIIYLLIEFVLGIVYIKKRLYYMNPVLSVLDYSVFECTGRDYTTKAAFPGAYIFWTRGDSLKENITVKYKNINARIIKLKEVTVLNGDVGNCCEG